MSDAIERRYEREAAAGDRCSEAMLVVLRHRRGLCPWCGTDERRDGCCCPRCFESRLSEGLRLGGDDCQGCPRRDR